MCWGNWTTELGPPRSKEERLVFQSLLGCSSKGLARSFATTVSRFPTTTTNAAEGASSGPPSCSSPLGAFTGSAPLPPLQLCLVL